MRTGPVCKNEQPRCVCVFLLMFGVRWIFYSCFGSLREVCQSSRARERDFFIMISVDEVWRILDGLTASPAGEWVPVEQCHGRVLVDRISALEDHPPFDRSSIDGFAVPAGSGEGFFRVCESPGEVVPGVALRIATGAEVPAGFGLVMVEDTRLDERGLEILKPASTHLIRRRGGSIRAGEAMLGAGSIVGPGEVALLAAEGIIGVFVFPSPRVLHVTTGSEIAPEKASPEAGQIRNSNAPMLRALMDESGATVLPGAHVDESVEGLISAVGAAAEFDVLLVSGGSSVGERDNTRTALESMGFEILVHGVCLKPGKPVLIGLQGRKVAIGIPGNPVSHFVVFHLFIRRLLDAMAGKRPVELVEARLEAGAPLGFEKRETFWPARCVLRSGCLVATPLAWVDSGDVAGLRGVNALLRLPAGEPPPVEGARVRLAPCGKLW